MNSKDRDYERLLESCIKLYDELESARNYINLLVTDIHIATEEIRDSFDIIDQRMNRCTELLRHLSYRPLSSFINFQGSVVAPESDADET